MLKVEKKLLFWAERHMYLLMSLLMSFLALYFKRLAIWWGSPDVGYYFDFHENHVQSALYYGLVRLLQLVPMIPLHSLKWLVAIADYGVAFLCVIAVGGHREKLKLKSTFYFTVCVLSPVVLLRGVCWAQIDAIAFGFLLGAYLLWEKGKKPWAFLLALLGITLYPCLFLVVFGYLFCQRKGILGKDWFWITGLGLGCCLLQGVSGLLLGWSWQEGISTCVRWASFHPYSGEQFREPLLWVKQMVNLFGYSLSMLSGMAAYKRKLPYGASLAVHLAVLLVYGSMMFPVE